MNIYYPYVLFKPFKFLSIISSPGEGNATHASVLAWKISWMKEPGGLQSMES